MKRSRPIERSALIERVVALGALLALALVAWHAAAIPRPWLYGYVVAAAGVGLVLYGTLRSYDQPFRRRLVQLLLGSSLLGAAALRDPISALFQIEGLFFDLLSGVLLAAVLHYLLAKLVGPLVFGRVWCGWACWTALLLDQLPWKRSRGRLHGRWGALRYVHFSFSLALVAALWFGFGYRPGVGGVTALMWFIAGNALYYGIGIGLALVLRDNRAFCKYVCPVAVPLKLSARPALLKVRGNGQPCCPERVCENVCPMDIRIADYLQRGQRVLTSECILCQACISVCPERNLSLSFERDRAGAELLHERAPAHGV